MKIRPLLLICFLLLLACKETPQDPSNAGSEKMEKTETIENTSPDFTIEESRVGNFTLGGEIPQTSDIYQIQKTKKSRVTEEGPQEETHYVLSRNQTEELILKPLSDTSGNGQDTIIGEIIVLTDHYKTQEGIGVNSTLKEFQKAYPHFKIWYTYVSDRYVLENSKTSLQFFLNEKDFIGKMEVNSVKMPLEATDFKEGAKIVKIRVYK